MLRKTKHKLTEEELQECRNWLPSSEDAKEIFKDMEHQFEFTSRFSPFEPYQKQGGRLYYLIHRALNLMDDLFVQPLPCTTEMTPELQEHENNLQNNSDLADYELECIAREIYLALTGKIIEKTQ